MGLALRHDQVLQVLGLGPAILGPCDLAGLAFGLQIFHTRVVHVPGQPLGWVTSVSGVGRSM